jgi:NADPH:quinone reductase-like Zn-dependent oxidoreductase
MRILNVDEFGVDNIVVLDAADPVPGDGEVMIKADAATINPVDYAIVTGAAVPRFPADARSPYTPGWDVVGTVVAIGSGVAGSLLGQRVLGFTVWFVSGRGTHASLVTLPLSDVTPVPDVLPSVQLTTVGLNGLTAWRAIDEIDPQPGEVLAITGAAGAIGGFATQLALARGVDVVAIVRMKDQAVAQSLGATYVVDGDTDDLRSSVIGAVGRAADAMLDTATLKEAALNVVVDGGRYVTLTETPAPARGITVTRAYGRMDQRGLRKLVEMASAGQLRTPVARTFPIEAAKQAYEAFAAGVPRGRVVLTFE